jgi:hypothetical protein
MNAATDALQANIDRDGFAFVNAAAMRELLGPPSSRPDWQQFAESWSRLELDTFMADGGRYRRRRYAAFGAWRDGPIVRLAHQPHYQSIDYNPLNGGIARWFEPIEDEIGCGPTMSGILEFCRTLFNGLSPDARAWHIEVHQFRIEANTGEAGRPTPEGVHRDGVDYVLVLLVHRRNIARGTTSIHALDGPQLGQFTLVDPFDSALVDDTRVAHGVTPVDALDPAEPAYRDVLVVTYRKSAAPDR